MFSFPLGNQFSKTKQYADEQNTRSIARLPSLVDTVATLDTVDTIETVDTVLTVWTLPTQGIGLTQVKPWTLLTLLTL